jgi:hypothetical protein
MTLPPGRREQYCPLRSLSEALTDKPGNPSTYSMRFTMPRYATVTGPRRGTSVAKSAGSWWRALPRRFQ